MDSLYVDLPFVIAFTSIIAILSWWFISKVILCGAKERSKAKSFPPGPWAWPIIGNMHLLGTLPHRALRDLSVTYGPLVGMRMGQKPAIVVCSSKLAREVLRTYDKVFANRPDFKLYDELFYPHDSGIVMTAQSSEWRTHRKICTSLFTFKRLQEMERVRLQEVSSLLHEIYEDSSHGEKPIDIRSYVSGMSAGLFMRLVQSEAWFHTRGKDLPDLITEVEREASWPLIGDLIPVLSWLDFWRVKRVRAVHNRVDTVLSAMIDQRMREMAKSSLVYNDLLQSLLSRLVGPNETPANSDVEEALTMREVKGIMMDVLAGGIHTTALAIEWGVAELLKHPSCLRRLRQEMDEALGENKYHLIVEEDLQKLTYLQCVIKEISRLHPVLPLLVPRMPSEGCEVGEYKIPPRTLTFVNVWAIGRDENVWENALEFHPERFENKNSDIKGQCYELLPFGSGRRMCAGLPVAISVVGLTLANLVHGFDLQLPDGQSPESMNMDEKTGISAGRASPTMIVPKPRFAIDFCRSPPTSAA